MVGLGAAAGGAFSASNAITITDFQVGAGGDRLELSAWLDSALQNYLPGADPFGSGHLRVQQSGADTLLQVDRNGGGDAFSTLATLRNVVATDLIPSNLDGFVSNLTPFSPMAGAGSADILTGGAGPDDIQGLDGNDVLTGGPSSDRLDGGIGFDTALYSGLSRAYSLTAGLGLAAVSGGPEGGSDSLTGIERIKFVDGYFNLSPLDTSAQVYRIYVAALGRTPDAAGLAGWVQAIDKGGQTAQAVANSFITSPEFLGRFGAGSNIEFLTLLYNNVLGRNPDQTGLDGWLNFLGAGHSRAEAVIGFSDSKEFVAGTASAVQQGIWVGDPNAAIAARFYDTVFGRLPDVAGETIWTAALQGGASLNTVANGFVASPEFQATYGALSNDAFVRLMYQNVLHRDADQPGLDSWVSSLNAGRSRAEVVVGFSESREHVVNTAPHIDDGVWFG